MRGVLVTLPARQPDANKTNKGLGREYQVAGANRRPALRFIEKSQVGGCRRSAVAQLFSLGHKRPFWLWHFDKRKVLVIRFEQIVSIGFQSVEFL